MLLLTPRLRGPRLVISVRSHARGLWADLHRDIKASNVLLDEALHAKVADFGTSRLVPRQGEALSLYVGTPIYLAPECIKHVYRMQSEEQAREREGEGSSALLAACDAKSDVFSFGVMLWELTHGTRVFEGLGTEQVMRKVVAGGRPEMRLRADFECFEGLMRSAWQQEPRLRPSMGECVTQLGHILQRPEMSTGIAAGVAVAISCLRDADAAGDSSSQTPEERITQNVTARSGDILLEGEPHHTAKLGSDWVPAGGWIPPTSSTNESPAATRENTGRSRYMSRELGTIEARAQRVSIHR